MRVYFLGLKRHRKCIENRLKKGDTHALRPESPKTSEQY